MSRLHRALRFALAALCLAALSLPLSGYTWGQFGKGADHSGNEPEETAITLANVNQLRRAFHIALPGVADGAPVLMTAVATPSGTRDLLFLTTRDGHILAVDAHTGQLIWQHQNGPGACHANNGSSPCYTSSSPALDTSGLYVYSYGLDGYVHKYQVWDGAEILGNGWPELTSAKPADEKESSDISITIAKNGVSYLYVTHAGYPGDQGDYQGHLTTINLRDGTQHVFNALCSNVTAHFVEQPGSPDCAQHQAAIWARGGVVYDGDTDKIYMATGNGDFNPAQFDWGDTVFALNPDGTGVNGGPLDSYTPANYQQLQNQDLDLGSTAPGILPAPPQSAIRHLAVQGGKDAMLRLLNLDNLSGQGGPGHTGGEIGAPIPIPQGGQMLTAPAIWTNPQDGGVWALVANANGVSGLKLVVDSNGVPSLKPMWIHGGGGFSPIVAGNVLYYDGTNSVAAINPATGAGLWVDNGLAGVHWESPIVANGWMYVTDEGGTLSGYTIPH